jgi:hypothetical protein
MNIHVACSLYKFAHASQYLHYYELFVIKKSIMHLVLYEFISIVNVVLKLQIKWHEGSDFIEVMAKFKELCGLPLIHSAINATLIHLQKSGGENFVEDDYYSFKSKGYNI